MVLHKSVYYYYYYYYFSPPAQSRHVGLSILLLLSLCPGLGRLLASAALLRTAPGPGTDFQRPFDHQNCRSVHSSASSRPTSSVPALDSAGCSCECRVPSSHRRCCDCTASSEPTTNVQTRLDSISRVQYTCTASLA